MDCPDDRALSNAELQGEVSSHLSGCERCAARRSALLNLAAADPLGATDLAKTAASPSGRSAPLLRPGESVGRYRVTGLLGEGGMGTVYGAFDPDLNRKVALKLLRTDFADADQAGELRARLLREAQAMARLSSPFVVHVFDVGTLRDQVWVAMELVEGATLAAWLAAQRRPPYEVIAKFSEAGRGLAGAHASGLVHRDFKPDNVLIGRDGRARVSDFGLARHTDTAQRVEPSGPIRLDPAALAALSAPLTRVGAVMGTPAYMAPEQFTGEPTDARTDQFSFCVALYEALHGERPFAGDTFDAVRTEVLAGRIRAAPPRANVSPRVRALLLRGLSRQPDHRFPSMDALLRELGRERPRGARGRVALGAVVATLVSVGLGHFANRANPCELGREELGEAWSAPREQAVSAAFAKGDPELAQLALRGLGRYATGWMAQRKDACLATRVKGTQSEAAMQQRMNCLDRRRSALDALTEALAAADVRALSRAPDAIANLPALEDCADLTRLSSEDDAESPAQRAAAAPLRKRIDAAHAQLVLGDIQKAKTTNDAALADAKSLGIAAVSAEALRNAGIIALYQGDGRRAEELLGEGVQDAVAAHQDALAAELGAHLLFAVASAPAKVDALRHTVDGLVTRAKVPRATALFHHALGYAALIAGRYPEATAEYERAASQLPPDDPNALESRASEALALSFTRDAPRALQLAQTTLDEVEKVRGRENPRNAIPLLATARQDVARGQFARARALATRAQGLLEPAHLPLDGVLEIEGLIAEGEGHSADAIASLHRALDAARAPSRKAAIRRQLARVLLEVGQLDDAAREAEEFRTSLSEGSPDLAEPLTYLGEVALARGERDKARALLEEAMKYRAAGNDPPSEGARTRFALARVTGDRQHAAQAAALDHAMMERSALQDEIAAWLAAHP